MVYIYFLIHTRNVTTYALTVSQNKLKKAASRYNFPENLNETNESSWL